jgi:serine/threonine-protein kinase RsbW
VGVIAVPGVLGKIGLRVPGAIGYRHLAIRLVSTACKMALEGASGEDDDFENEVVSAFGEAFNNIAVHGYRGLVPGSIQVEVDWDDTRLMITVIDTGRTFDPGAVALPNLDELPENGMGLFIMHGCMDEVDYRPGPPNVLRLVKLRARGGMLPSAPPDDGDPSGTDPISGDRGSGVDVITGPPRTGNVVSAPSTGGWQMTAAPGRTAEGSRRK